MRRLLLAAFALAALTATAPAADPKLSLQPDKAWKPLGDNLWFDPKSKMLIVKAEVALRDGPLEHLLCLKGTKEHESILATKAPPRLIHAGLLLTGAEPGHPVRFEPKFEPPTGSAVSIRLEWVESGKKRSSDARSWIKDLKAKKALETDWVFAGSALFTDPQTKEKFYAADDGDLITVANFGSSILDLPYRSKADDSDRLYVAETPAIPERGTVVFMYFAPKPPAAAPKK